MIVCGRQYTIVQYRQCIQECRTIGTLEHSIFIVTDMQQLVSLGASDSEIKAWICKHIQYRLMEFMCSMESLSKND